MISERLTFPGSSGASLSARLSLPADGRAVAYALFAHCFTCSKDLKPLVNISRALTQRGIGVVRFDFTGLGESAGDFEHTDFSSDVADLLAAADFMSRTLAAPSILLGHSLGGAAVIAAVGRMPSVRAVSTIGAPFDPGHVTGLFEESMHEIRERGKADVVLGGRTFTVTRDFVEDVTAQRMEACLRELRRPLLVFHSPVDNTVGIENAARIYEAARHPKSFVSLDDADHLLLEEKDSRYVGQVLAAWAERYVDYAAPAASIDDLRADNGVATRTAAGSFRTDIVSRGHALIADEPVAVGGEDLGPSPYDLLSAALGACTSMTLRMYADRKKWPLEQALVHLEHERIHGEDGPGCEHSEPKMDRVSRTVTLVGPLDDDQRRRLMEIADRCPVHRTLGAGMVIETSEAP